MDPNVPFSDTSARRAELMEATEQYKSSIESNVQLLKEDAAEVGKSVALVSGVCLAVYLIASASSSVTGPLSSYLSGCVSDRST